ncbi:MAG: hypothetical protein LIO53_02275 [Oscillospiraceae bacterium]|nr:hypothetical protein [Oscillospiraceae bacterium]
MMKVKAIIAAALASMTLAAVPSAFAADIAPTTVIDSSVIGDLNILNNIFSYDFGSGDSGVDTTIAPTTVISGIDANLVNIVNTVVSCNINIDINDLSGIISDLRADLLSNMSK